ncbi:MAG: FkbM family methyltransferase [Bryobacteraceae bacterium]
MKSVVSTLTRRLRRLAALTSMPVYCRLYGLQRIGPSYFVRTTINDKSIVLDCGLGYDADFSAAIITRYGAQCHGVDPTRKHQAVLATVAGRHGDRLRLYPVAVAGTTGFMTFYEPIDQVSGSVFNGHVNASRAISYAVPSMTLKDLAAHIGVSRIDVLKLDVEGAEYDILEQQDDEWVKTISQIIVEFHHHCVKAFTLDDTKRAVAKLRSMGYRSYSTDGINYLFFRK